MSEAWLKMPAADLGRGIATGRIDPVELAETFLAAIAAHPLGERIYARLQPERTRAEAEAARGRQKEGLLRGPLDGVPLSWKDLFDTAGLATEAGSALLEGRVPERDARVLHDATEAGTVFLGKTHMSELAFSGLGYNPVTATPPSVNDAEAVAGGSSSGAAASVAFGLAPAAIGSDTGGSVRIPAAWNDLVGLKTTAGRLSLEGVVPLCPRFDTVGPLARTVEDAALLLAALEGGKPADLTDAALDGLRFAVLTTAALDDLRPEPARGFEAAVARIAAGGAGIVEMEAPEVAEALPLSGILYTSEAWGIWGETIEQAPELMFPEILERFRAGRKHRAADYVAAWRKLEALRARFAARTAAFDAVLLPTSPILPPKTARLAADHDYYVTENLLALRNTRIGNLMGGPAVTLPTGVPSTGLMLLGRPFEEERLLRVAKAVEAVLGA